ncbi:MAG: HTTM domain-containing protein, partial [Anaerolineae bacterium]|nr:HTTM domain-containing protein [Anaerolineae bacterium]
MTAIDFHPSSFIPHPLRKPVNIGPLVVLRIAFGLLMFLSIVRFMAKGWIQEFYVLPQFHFTYYGFGWVKPLPEWGLWLVFVATAVFSLFIAAGFLYRLSMISFFLLFTYVELLDKTYYLNHYYFISLLSFLLIFLPLNGAWSFDIRFGWTKPRPFVPAWMVWAVRVQLGLVYFFAGVAKINADWLLAALPLRIWLQARTETAVIGSLFDEVWTAFVMSWGGMLFDLTIFFWLSWRKTRLLAYVAVVVFHGLTGLLFNIGMFSWIMIACTLVFFDWQVSPSPSPSQREGDLLPLPRGGVRGGIFQLLLVIFLGIQFLLPLRHLLYPGDVNWTEEGFRFAWRVMLVEKTGHATFFVRNPETGREWIALPSDYLTLQQEKQMSFQPDMIVQFAHFLAEQYEYPVEVRAE